MTQEPDDDEAAAIAAAEADGARNMTAAQLATFDRIVGSFADRFFAMAWVGNRVRIYVKDWTAGATWDTGDVEVHTCARSMYDLEAAQEAAEPVYELLARSGALDHVSLDVPRAMWRMQLRREPTADEAKSITRLTDTGAFDVVVNEGEWSEFSYD